MSRRKRRKSAKRVAVLQPLYKWTCKACHGVQLEPFWPVELRPDERQDISTNTGVALEMIGPGKLHRTPQDVSCERCGAFYDEIVVNFSEGF